MNNLHREFAKKSRRPSLGDGQARERRTVAHPPGVGAGGSPRRRVVEGKAVWRSSPND